MSQTDEFDAIVVGSGITGGWAAKELCERGLRVLVLERGRNVEHGTGYTTEHLPPWQVVDRGLPQRELYARDYAIQSQARGFDPFTMHYWNNDRENPYAQTEGKPFNWLRANVVGGKSLMWGRQSHRWSDLDFGANKRDGHGCDWPIRYADIKDWYSYVEKFIGVSGEALGLPQLPDGEFQPPMQLNVVEQAFRRGVENRWPGRRVTIGRVANLTQPIGDRASCHYCGPCARGCSAGAYFSSQSSTLPAARKTGNLTLHPDSVVERLEYDAKRGRVTAVHVVDSQTKARRRHTARIVFLCASTYATNQLLLNSRSDAFPNGLANRSGTLGRYIMDHMHGHGGTAAMPGFESKYYFGNRPNTLYVPRVRNVSGDDEGVDFVRGYGYQGLAAPDEWNSMWNSTPGFGAEYKRALRHPGQWRMFLLAFGECLPYEDNRVVLDGPPDRFGIPQLRFDFSYRENERRMGEDIIRDTSAMLEAAGGSDIKPFTKPFTPGTSIHEFGGVRMGNDPSEAVLNAHNQAHDVPNVFATDGSCMSSTSCVNPSLTFMALTARAASYAVEELKARGELRQKSAA